MICLFLKSPSIGVKTRLARDIGEEKALRIFRFMVEHQVAQIPPKWETSIYYTPMKSLDEFKDWLGPLIPDAHFVFQSEGDLGQRFENCVEEQFKAGAERVLIIVSDCPGLTRDYLYEADRALSNSDVVIGPARDGGWNLIGMRRPQIIFRGIDWSTDRVFKQTMDQCSNLSVHVTRALMDVDDADSLKAYSTWFSDVAPARPYAESTGKRTVGSWT
jgi:rSAM/selenodomain-associated transferase 1